jgi:hypothetical protein
MTTTPDADTLARWWVQLNMWIWPDDLPAKPAGPQTNKRDIENAIRGAWAVVDLFADMELVDAIWRDDEARNALRQQAKGVGE